MYFRRTRDRVSRASNVTHHTERRGPDRPLLLTPGGGEERELVDCSKSLQLRVEAREAHKKTLGNFRILPGGVPQVFMGKLMVGFRAYFRNSFLCATT